MRGLVTLAAAMSLIAADVCEAGGKPHERHGRRYVHHPSSHITRASRYRRTEGWYDHNADRLPIGSFIWWEEMEAEGRAGNPRP